MLPNKIDNCTIIWWLRLALIQLKLDHPILFVNESFRLVFQSRSIYFFFFLKDLTFFYQLDIIIGWKSWHFSLFLTHIYNMSFKDLECSAQVSWTVFMNTYSALHPFTSLKAPLPLHFSSSFRFLQLSLMDCQKVRFLPFFLFFPYRETSNQYCYIRTQSSKGQTLVGGCLESLGPFIL